MKKKFTSLFMVTCLSLTLALSPSGEILELTTHPTAATYVYWATKYGKKYHSSRSCWTLSRSKSVKKITVKKAKSLGLTKCKVCY